MDLGLSDEDGTFGTLVHAKALRPAVADRRSEWADERANPAAESAGFA